MDEEDQYCDRGVLVIDLDDEVVRVEEIDKETPVAHSETNQNKINDDKSLGNSGIYPKIKNIITEDTHSNTNELSKKKYMSVRVIEDAASNNIKSFLRQRLSRAIEATNYSTNVNELQNHRGLGNSTHRQDTNDYMYEMGARGRAKRVTEKTVTEPDIYDPGYAMEDYLPHDLIIHRPSRTDIYNRDVPNLAHRLQAANAYGPEVNALRADVYDDYRHAKIDRNVHALRLDALGDDHDPRLKGAYILAHDQEVDINMGYRPIMNINPYEYHHRREDVLNRYDSRHPMHRYAVHDHYRPQATSHFDRYRSREELAHVYTPDIFVKDPYTLDPAFHRQVFYPEAAINMCAYPQAPQMDHYRHNLSRYVRRQEVIALNHGEEVIDAPARSEADVTMNLNRVQLPILNPRNEIDVPLAINKKKSEIRDKPVMSVYRNEKTPSYRATAGIGNNIQFSSIRRLEAVDGKNMKPGVSVGTNTPDTVILGTKSINRTGTSSKENANLPQETILANTMNNRDQNVYKIVKKVNNNDETQISKKAQTGDKKQINLEKETTVVSAKLCTNIATPLEINEVAQENNIRFLVVFFERVKELVKDILPEFSKALQKEIEKLGKKDDNKLKTCIRYICPRHCSVSTYCFPGLDTTDDHYKVETLAGAHICDLCSCIQSCYIMYKNKYFNLLSTYIDEGKERRNEREGFTKNNMIKRKNATIDDNIPSLNVNEEINKKSPNDSAQLRNVAHINGNVPITNQNVEYTLFNALSNLTFNLPNDSTEDTHSSRKEKPSQKMHDELVNANIFSKDYIKPVVSITFNIEPETVNDTNYRIGEDNFKKEQITPSASNEIYNADISFKLGNKIGRKPNAVFTCHVCTCLYTNFMSLVNHMQKEHNINGSKEDIQDQCLARKCPLCGVYSKQKYHNLHVKRYHPEIFTFKGEPVKTRIKKQYKEVKAEKCRKKKFVFTCLICNEELRTCEVNGHREKIHKGVNVEKMFSKKLKRKV